MILRIKITNSYKKISFLLLVFCSLTQLAHAQNVIYPNAVQNQPPIVVQQDLKSKLVDQIIEGSKVVVDLVKVFAHLLPC